MLTAAVLAQAPNAASPAKLQQAFLEAGRAYDQGRLDEAVSRYNDLMAQGYESKELLFNLGNAYFRLGKTGLAVVNYRRAWRLAPRDPDVLANLRFALQHSGGLAPTFAGPVAALLWLSLGQWVFAGTAAYWLASVSAALLMVLRTRRTLLLRAAIGFGLVLLVSVAGMLAWTDLYRRPEMVVIEPKQEALFAPLAESTAHFAVPEGSIVRALDRSGDWVKVASGRQAGWMRLSSCLAVWPRMGEKMLGPPTGVR